MKITIVGSGALGMLLAAHLARTKNETWLVVDNADIARQISQEGVKLENLSGSSRIKINAVSSAKDIGAADVVIICAKSYNTESAVKNSEGIIGDKTYVLSLQNGVGNLQLIGEFVDNGRVIGGVTYHSFAQAGDAAVKHAGKGETIIGQQNGKVLGEIQNIAAALSKAGFETKVTKDINSAIWSKLVIDAGIGAVSAVTKLKNGALAENEYAREIMRRAVSEAAKVAKKKKARLAYDDPIQKAEAVCKATAGNLSAMLQDVLGGCLTEIDAINGAIVRHAKSLNIKTPTNEILTELVKAMEPQCLK